MPPHPASLLRVLAFCALGLATPLAAQAEGKSIIVLDGSGSMWGQIDGRAKLEIAREALSGVLAGVAPETELGLMVYGHRSKGDCNDIELMVPPAAGTGPAIAAAAAGMQFLGKTPLTEAVRRAAAELRSTEEKATVILITDGIETCDADPCALGAELEASGVDFTAHVVGFGLTAEEGKQVACLADATGGLYIEAKDAGSLTEALKTTVVVAEPPPPPPAPEPKPAPKPAPAAVEFNLMPRLFYAAGGEEVADDLGAAWELHLINADGSTGERLTTEYGSIKLNYPPGSYRLLVSLDEARVETDVTPTADAVARPDVILNAGVLVIHPRGSADGPVEDDAAVIFWQGEERITTHYGDTSRIVPAGPLDVEVTVGKASVRQTLTVVAGERLEVDMIAAAGLAAIEGYYAEGTQMEGGDHTVTILAAKQALDGSRERIDTAYGAGSQFTLPPGDYLVRVEQDLASAESAFTVKPGERVDVPVILNAGVMAISAPGATSIEIEGAKKNIEGKRPRLHTSYDAELSLVAAAGDYVVLVFRGDVKTEVPVSVKAGERSEVAVP
ncbi:vWA domain-containing protein [Rhodobacter ferrooxidans]|uniref:von Willebrand factor type A n=1 Tax=Rhodobacter ferrooxidans TaxID=371731 RepID=C8RYY1_9RHOB|nr:VWA domain-containing protein [Rhodobacter sp. SW2]EEW25938.1 von Willebrand factor type A [Rhodobacter sp. SW2]